MDTKEQKLAHYATREPHEFIQYDVFTNVGPGDWFMHGDQDDDSVFGQTTTTELMTGMSAVQVLIVPGTSTADAIRALSKIISWIAKDGVTDLSQARWDKQADLMAKGGASGKEFASRDEELHFLAAQAEVIASETVDFFEPAQVEGKA